MHLPHTHRSPTTATSFAQYCSRPRGRRRDEQRKAKESAREQSAQMWLTPHTSRRARMDATHRVWISRRLDQIGSLVVYNHSEVILGRQRFVIISNRTPMRSCMHTSPPVTRELTCITNVVADACVHETLRYGGPLTPGLHHGKRAEQAHVSFRIALMAPHSHTPSTDIWGEIVASERSKYTKNNQHWVSISVRPFAFILIR